MPLNLLPGNTLRNETPKSLSPQLLRLRPLAGVNGVHMNLETLGAEKDVRKRNLGAPLVSTKY